MYSFNLRIAGYTIGVTTQHIRAYAICRDFLTDDQPDFSICVKNDDIELVKRGFEKSRGICGMSDSHLEVTALLGKLAEEFVNYNVLLFHGAVVALGSDAYLFSAPSGTGKTTHALRWLKEHPDAYIVNGDKPFIRFSGIGEPPLACASPWAGKENIYTNTMVPLRAITLLERGDKNVIRKVAISDAFPELIEQVYKPTASQSMRVMLKLFERLGQTTPIYRYQFDNYKPDVVEIAFDMIAKRNGNQASA